jgi:hypothetical protein
MRGTMKMLNHFSSSVSSGDAAHMFILHALQEVVSSPFIGKVAEVSVLRVVGTIIGAFLGEHMLFS